MSNAIATTAAEALATCMLCGCPITRNPSNLCRPCVNIVKRAEATTTLTCEHCGKEFQRSVHNVNSNSHFCSRKCVKAAAALRKSAYTHTCKQCGKEFFRYLSQGKLLFCSYECASADSRLTFAGANGPGYIDGRTPLIKRIRRSAAYDEWRRAVLVKAGNKCTACQRYGVLHAHHVRPFAEIAGEFLASTDGSWETALGYAPFWDVDNGLALCHACHSIEHPDVYLMGGAVDATR